tara:strand:+ start:42678 stop:43478 length:801 start_codon:yes stop_codon:yes gene_type:complete
MAGGEQIENSVRNLMLSPGGQIISDGSKFLRGQAKLLIGLFLISVVTAFSLTKSVVSWLIAEERLPDDVNIIVTSPIEFILLQFQIAVSFGLVVIITYLILSLVRKGSKNDAVRARLAELKLQPPKFSSTFILTLVAIITLGLSGLIYSWEFLTPMILQYLTDDAQSAGLTTEWRLSGYVGFIVNLALACVIGFQAPVATILTLRFGIATRQQILQYRKHIWFTAFVLGAFLSPPDPLSLFLVAMPVVVLFEVSIIIDRITKISNA